MNHIKEGGINYVSRKFLVMCKSYVLYYLKQLFNFSIISLIYPNVFKIAQLTTKHKKCFLHKRSIYRLVSVLSNLSKVLEILYITVFDVSIKHINFVLKIDSA